MSVQANRLADGQVSAMTRSRMKPVDAWIRSGLPVIRYLTTISLAFSLLSGCIALPLPGAGWAVAPLLLSGSATVELPGYSLGPVSSERFPELIMAAIPPSEGTVHLYGASELLVQLDNRPHDLSAVASLTDTHMLFLKWHDQAEQYEIVSRLPYSEIQALSTNSWGLGRIAYLCLATSAFGWGDQTYAIDQRASMSFIEASGYHQDVEKTQAAIDLLYEKIEPVEDACEPPAQGIEESVEAAKG
jgi:hypothetical protein